MNTLALGRAGVQRATLAGIEDGKEVPLRTWRCGTQITADFVAALGAEGRIFTAQFGTLDTPVALQTSFTATLPSLVIENVDEQILIPLYYEISPVATGAAIFRTHLAMTPQKLCSASAFAGTILTEGTGDGRRLHHRRGLPDAPRQPGRLGRDGDRRELQMVLEEDGFPSDG